MKEQTTLRQLKNQALDLVRQHAMPTTPEAMKILLYTLAAKQFADAEHPLNHPPEALFHIAQVDLIQTLLLQNQPEDVRKKGSMLANSHDLGRMVTMDMRHCLMGGIMFRQLGVDNDLVFFTVAHHRWGQGVKALSNGFALNVQQALRDGTIRSFITNLLDSRKADLAGFAVLIADNSKELLTPGSFEPSIVSFDRALGERLVQKQVNLRRIQAGSDEHHAELTGMEFLTQVIPVMEDILHVSYREVIAKAQGLWPEHRSHIVALWDEIAYHHTDTILYERPADI